jgi:hypothetical protein
MSGKRRAANDAALLQTALANGAQTWEIELGSQS